MTRQQVVKSSVALGKKTLTSQFSGVPKNAMPISDQPPDIDTAFAMLKSFSDTMSPARSVMIVKRKPPNTRFVTRTDSYLDEEMNNKQENIDKNSISSLVSFEKTHKPPNPCRHLACGFVQYDLDVIEVYSPAEAAAYVTLAVDAVVLSKNRKAGGEFKTKGEICKSVPFNESEGKGIMYFCGCR